LTEIDIERERMACAFCLGGGELHEPHPDFPDEWDGTIAYWYEGTPEYATEYRDEHDCRTALMSVSAGLPSPPDGWELLGTHTASGEAECWWCGPGTGWDGSDEQVLAEHHAEMPTPTGYRGDPKCKLCGGDGHVYLGGGWAEVVFARLEDEDE